MSILTVKSFLSASHFLVQQEMLWNLINHVLRPLVSHFFINRIINLWNSLPGSIVTAPTANSIKRKLSKFLLQVYYFLILPVSVFNFTVSNDFLGDC